MHVALYFEVHTLSTRDRRRSAVHLSKELKEQLSAPRTNPRENRIQYRLRIVRGKRRMYVDPGGKDSEAWALVLGRDGENTSIESLV